MPTSSKSNVATIILVAIIVFGIVVIVPPVRIALLQSQRAYGVSYAKQIKIGLDSFAMDNDGRYPSAKTAAEQELPPPKSSNDYFRQAFDPGILPSRESPFWIKKSKVCSRRDPSTAASATVDPLPPGANHWAYSAGLKESDNPETPIVLDSYVPRTTTFDKDLWDGLIMVARIDGSARPERLSPAGLVLDGDGKNLLTTASQVWKEATPDLRQPDPAP